MNALAEIREHAHAIVDVIEREDALAAHGHNGGPPPADYTPADPITVKVAQEIVEHEGLVREAYLDSVGVWTWGLGVTNKSGHRIDRYKDAPTTLARVIEIYVWLLRTEYAPDVLAEFEGFPMTEAQFAAALSFHWNTGAIRSASWPDLWRAGKVAESRASFMQWRKPASIIDRRHKECALFFDGEWSQDGFASVIPVKKPSYQPNFSKAKQVDIRPALKEALS